MNCKAPMPMTEFDMATLDDSTQMMKAIIPFLSYPMQKSMAVMIRIKELTDTIRCYSHGQVFPDRSNASQSDMMSALGQCCPPDIQNSINMMSQMMQFSNAMNMYKDMEQSPEFMNIMNMMKDADNEMPPSQPEDPAKESVSDTSCLGNMTDYAEGPPPDAVLQEMMNNEQMDMYNDYLREIDDIFARTENITEAQNPSE